MRKFQSGWHRSGLPLRRYIKVSIWSWYLTCRFHVYTKWKLDPEYRRELASRS